MRNEGGVGAQGTLSGTRQPAGWRACLKISIVLINPIVVDLNWDYTHTCTTTRWADYFSYRHMPIHQNIIGVSMEWVTCVMAVLLECWGEKFKCHTSNNKSNRASTGFGDWPTSHASLRAQSNRLQNLPIIAVAHFQVRLVPLMLNVWIC